MDFPFTIQGTAIGRWQAPRQRQGLFGRQRLGGAGLRGPQQDVATWGNAAEMAGKRWEKGGLNWMDVNGWQWMIMDDNDNDNGCDLIYIIYLISSDWRWTCIWTWGLNRIEATKRRTSSTNGSFRSETSHFWGYASLSHSQRKATTPWNSAFKSWGVKPRNRAEHGN